MCFIRQGPYVDFGKKASYSCVTRRMPNIRRRQKPRNPELFITTIFMATILSSCTGSAAAEQSESQRDNNHRREKQYQLKQLEQSIEEQQKINQELENQLEKGKTDQNEAIGKAAFEQYGYGYPDEHIYIDSQAS